MTNLLVLLNYKKRIEKKFKQNFKEHNLVIIFQIKNFEFQIEFVVIVFSVYHQHHRQLQWGVVPSDQP